MKVEFPKQATSEIIALLTKEMSGRSLGDLVKLEASGQDLVVKISKLGTSVLTFTRTEAGSNAVFELTSEKIAFAHKAFKDEVKQKLISVISKAGGKAVG